MLAQGLIFPEKLATESTSLTSTYGKFIAEPFDRGYGHTVGNSLRRILLSSLEGAAVTAVRIKGAVHEFVPLRGVREDVIHIMLNLKQLRLKLYSQGPEILHLKVRKEGEVKAKDIESNSQVEILAPELVIAHLDFGGELDMELEVNRGRGYAPAEAMKNEGQPLGTIPLDALFSPVTKVHYEVENARVGQMTDYDKLILEIWTDRSVSPGDALAYAARILKDSLSIFVSFEERVEPSMEISPPSDENAKLKELLNQPVDMIELSVRASNCLKVAKIKTIGDLVRKTEDDLLSYKNFGKKSLEEIQSRLKELGIGLGMEV